MPCHQMLMFWSQSLIANMFVFGGETFLICRLRCPVQGGGSAIGSSPHPEGYKIVLPMLGVIIAIPDSGGLPPRIALEIIFS